MKKLILILFTLSTFWAQGQSYQPTPENLEARKWFQDARYGLFIHWGVYSILGDGEWVMNNQNIPVKAYERLPKFFNPTAFDAKRWVQIAKNAGMKYITFTSKHHDGFAMWHSKISPYNIVDDTPYQKDVIKMLADECEKEGIKLFLYYSHLDWHHPDYFPRGKTGKQTGRPESGDFGKYLTYMDTQLTELLSGNYGKIGGIWFDGWWDQSANDPNNPQKTLVDWKLRRTYDLIHKLQPAALVGNNHHVAPFEGEDFQMFERDLPGQNHAGFSGTSTISELPLETCETLNGGWGFELKDEKYKSPAQLIRYLAGAAGRNANFLLNVGPMPNGEIQPEFVERLESVGNWLKKNGETIYGTRGGIVPPQEWGVSTKKGDSRHFFHILTAPKTSYLFVPDFKVKVTSVNLFNGGKTLKFKQQPEGLFIYLDGVTMDPWDTVLEVQTK